MALSEESGQFAVAQRELKQSVHAGRPRAARSRGRSQGYAYARCGGSERGAAQPGQQGQGQRHRRDRVAGWAAIGPAGRQPGRGDMASGEWPAVPGVRWRGQSTSPPRLRHGGRAAARPGRPGEPARSPQAKVRQIGTKTFYFKNGRWVDSSVKPDEDAKAEKVVQFTDDYFRLARTQKAEYNQYFSQEEPVTVKLDGKVYHIDPHPRMRRSDRCPEPRRDSAHGRDRPGHERPGPVAAVSLSTQTWSCARPDR